MANSMTYNGATIRAKSDLTIADEDRINTLLYQLPKGTIIANGYKFAEFMITAQIEGEPPVAIVTERDSEEVINASFEAWRALPRKFGKQWQALVNEAESAEKND